MELPLSLNVQRKIYKDQKERFFIRHIILNESAANYKNTKIVNSSHLGCF